MFKNLELTFKKGTVLTKEMLEELQAFPKDSLDILYDRYPDGILAGTDLTEKEAENGKNIIYIKKGLIKYKDCIYRMTEDINLTEQIDQWIDQGIVEEQTSYQLVFTPKEQEFLEGRSTQILYSLQLKVFPKSEKAEGIIFAQFKLLDKGEVALFHEVDMEDISRPAYWNMTECHYACKEGVTYHPYNFEMIKRKLLSKKRRSPLDYIILNQITMTGMLSFKFMELILNDNQIKTCCENRETVLRDFLAVLMKEAEAQEESDNGKIRKKEEGRLLP